MDAKTGNYAFLMGVLVALLAALGLSVGPTLILLMALGVIVGFLNVSRKETTKFLLASITLITVGAVSGVIAQIPILGSTLARALLNITVFTAFAALIVALNTIKDIAED